MSISIPEWLIALIVIYFIADRYILCWWTNRLSSGAKDDVNEHMFKAVEVGVRAAEKSSNQSAAIAGILAKELEKQGTYALAAKRLLNENKQQTIYLPVQSTQPIQPDGDETGNVPQPDTSEDNGVHVHNRFVNKQDM